LANRFPQKAPSLKTSQRIAGSEQPVDLHEDVPAYRGESKEVYAREGIFRDEEVETHRG